MLDAGGVIIEILETTGFTAPPVQMDLESWINTYGLECTAVMDVPGTGTVTLNTYGGREQVFIVDLTTMTVLVAIQGSVAGVGPSSIEQGVPMLLALLGEGGG